MGGGGNRLPTRRRRHRHRAQPVDGSGAVAPPGPRPGQLPVGGRQLAGGAGRGSAVLRLRPACAPTSADRCAPRADERRSCRKPGRHARRSGAALRRHARSRPLGRRDAELRDVVEPGLRTGRVDGAPKRRGGRPGGPGVAIGPGVPGRRRRCVGPRSDRRRGQPVAGPDRAGRPGRAGRPKARARRPGAHRGPRPGPSGRGHHRLRTRSRAVGGAPVHRPDRRSDRRCRAASRPHRLVGVHLGHDRPSQGGQVHRRCPRRHRPARPGRRCHAGVGAHRCSCPPSSPTSG